MERLTVKTETGAALKLNDPHTEKEVISLFVAAYRAAVDRLAAYEDGGLEPYHIPSILADNHEIIGECKRLKAENYKLRELLKEAVEDITTAASDFYEYCSVCKYRLKDNICEYRMNHNNCINASGFRWQHADEAEEVLKDGNP